MISYDSFKRVVGSFLFFTGVPSLVSLFAPKLGWDWLVSFLISLFIMWVFSIELRLKDLNKTKGKKNGTR
jgi:hypothetical protein